ncbi:MAG TPA: hypothetical protein DCS07_14750 [Bdellovibrionales bacterium]|nr:MAG: hypothetical protein A2Z97_13965 [Bdellovibrionales bacterium GWB1_52_6]OFZ06406.1 MAG: hypothetical protein A2X97_03015 [Bdellovibrionales bacterium GWA1_52_35]OFZ39946.1 MAG: hypothetical protein A2070_07830 [Bdellovibrionales bacterium GWC1_52_8]HAR43870.1 hypothetical protein [Bdellovibrionales bacterium]HCM40163.1 hypothetical protein [Bdellovibrionales bacterium]
MAERQKVQVWIYRRGDGQRPWEYLVLLMKPERGGFWQPVTGSVEDGEAVPTAALREAKEETGFEFEHPVESLKSSFTFESRGHRFREHGFGLEAPQEGKVRLDPHEHIAYRWVSAEEALKLMRFSENAAMLSLLLKHQNRSGS